MKAIRKEQIAIFWAVSSRSWMQVWLIRPRPSLLNDWQLMTSCRRDSHCLQLCIRQQAHSAPKGISKHVADSRIPEVCWPVILAETKNVRFSERPCLREVGQKV